MKTMHRDSDRGGGLHPNQSPSARFQLAGYLIPSTRSMKGKLHWSEGLEQRRGLGQQ